MEPVLSGFRVLDFGHYIPGPYTAMLLAEQGAEVIKIENPQGDPLRDDVGFRVWNRSKKGLILDLKKQEAVEAAQALIKESDVLIENFSPGVADRLGIGFETASKINPELVYCSISGYGQTGPYRDRPGWDALVSSTAAIYVEQGGGTDYPPAYLVLPLASYYASFMAAYSITLALYAREKTGKGQLVDVSLFRAIMGAGCGMLVDYEERIRLPWMDQQGSAPLYKFYKAKDGKWLFLGLGNLTFFAKFALALGHEEWLVDPRFEGAPFMILPPISYELVDMLKEIFITKTRDEWLEFLRAEDIPCAPAQGVQAYMDDPQVAANNMVAEIDEPGLGKLRQMGVPLRLAETPGAIQGRSPGLGEHTREILTGLLGYSDEKAAGLK